MRSWRNGRRASLRCLWGKPRGSSSLLDRTSDDPGSAPLGMTRLGGQHPPKPSPGPTADRIRLTSCPGGPSAVRCGDIAMDDDFRKAALDYHRLPRPGKLAIEPI